MSSITTYDVWLVVLDKIYRGVPSAVVSDWASQGRLGPLDKIAVSQSEQWQELQKHPIFADYMARPEALTAQEAEAAALAPSIEMDVYWGHKKTEEDIDPDLIPLIDISLVLLIFFMMTAAVSALSPIKVPEVESISKLSGEKEAITIIVDKRGEAVLYALSIGEAPPSKAHRDLPNVTSVMNRLSEHLQTETRAPQVRIACHEDLPRSRFREVARELERFKSLGKIAAYAAEVSSRE